MIATRNGNKPHTKNGEDVLGVRLVASSPVLVGKDIHQSSTMIPGIERDRNQGWIPRGGVSVPPLIDSSQGKRLHVLLRLQPRMKHPKTADFRGRSANLLEAIDRRQDARYAENLLRDGFLWRVAHVGQRGYCCHLSKIVFLFAGGPLEPGR